MILLSSDLGSSLRHWEIAEYVAEGFVILACAGELVALIRRIPRRCREQIETWSTVVLVIALGIGLKCLMKTNELSGMEIGSLGEAAEQADEKARQAFADSNTALSHSKDALGKASLAQDSLGKAESEAEGAQTAASNALTLATAARREADSFEQDIKSAKEQSASAESHLADALQRTANAERELSELREQQKPRRILDEKRSLALALLKANVKGDIGISCLNSDKEGCDFAKDIADLLMEAGWQVSGPTGVMVLSASGGPPLGLTITIKAPPGPARAIILQRVFERIGFSAPGQLNANAPEDSVVLFVGTKP
jgi:hypothetical protein